MKTYYLSILLLCFFKISSSQNVNIPDTNFKSFLLNHDPIIDTNGDGEIQVAEAELVTEINVSSTSISSIQGLEAFVNLIELELSNFSYYNNDLVIENLPNLFSLSLSSFSASSVGLINLPSLNEVNISNNSNESFNTLGFNNCSNVETLILADTFYLSNLNLSNLVNLRTFHAYGLNSPALGITQLDLSGNVNLEEISLTATLITDLDFSNQPNLQTIGIYWQSLNSINLSNNQNLNSISLDIGGLTTLDLSQNPNIDHLEFYQANIEYLNLKNGNVPSYFSISSSSNIDYICADEEELSQLQNFLMSNPNTVVNSYCSFTPGGEYYIIEGESRVDANTNGCDVGDNFYPNIKLELTDGTNAGTYLADTSGSYSVPVSEGMHTMTPVLENPDYFTVSPTSSIITFPDAGGSYVQDFCLSPNGIHNDVEVVIVPTSGAVPGFDSYYTILYRNKGNIELNGTVSLDFEDDYMDFISALPAETISSIGNLQWNYSNLQPFETRAIEVVFNLNTPTDITFPLNDGDVLDFDISIDPIVNDETISDNTFSLKEIVVNSYDPNDVTCLEGLAILPEHVGEYVHYRIRFENLGTANATNIVVKDVVDTTKFDVPSLIPLHASHNYTTRIREGNVVEFIFEGINLPFDDANNDGYLVFKIKTLETLQLGDTFTNQAEIYFDFNFPVITNMYSTSVQENLSVNDFELNDVVLFPNPVNNQLYIKSNLNIDTIKIFDINGRLIQNKTMNDSNVQNEVSVSALKSGVYFIEVYSNGQKEVLRFIKK